MATISEKINDRHSLKTALGSLSLTPAERAELGALVHGFQDGDGLRAVFAREITGTLAGRPAELEAYERFAKVFAARNPFAFMPLGEILLRVVCASRLLLPKHGLWESVYQMLRVSTRGVFGNPAMQIARAAAGDDMRMFIELTMSGEDRFGNYIKHREFRALGPRHVEILSVGTYPKLEKILNVPYAESMFAHFGVEGEVALEEMGERESALTLKWR